MAAWASTTRAMFTTWPYKLTRLLSVMQRPTRTERESSRPHWTLSEPEARATAGYGGANAKSAIYHFLSLRTPQKDGSSDATAAPDLLHH